MSFVLAFEAELAELDQRIAALPKDGPAFAEAQARRTARERELYPRLNAYDKYLLAMHPLRPKSFDYIRYCFHDVKLAYNPDVRGDHLMLAGEGKLEMDGRSVDVIFIGQQTGPSSDRDELLKLPGSEYRRWNQGMGFPDSYRKAVYFMDLAEERGWPVVVFVDTPGADPSEYSEEEGQAFAINEVIERTTRLRVPNLSYIINLGASGGAIAITPTNRTIMNEYATYMVISPGGCASILFHNRNLESIRRAAEGLRLTSTDARAQDTVDEVVAEGLRPAHRYPEEVLAAGRDAVVRNLRELLAMPAGTAEESRREKFFAMGRWGRGESDRAADTLARLAVEQSSAYQALRDALAGYVSAANRGQAYEPGQPVPPPTAGAGDVDEAARDEALRSGRMRIARVIYAVEQRDTAHLEKELGVRPSRMSRNQWALLSEQVRAMRYEGDDEIWSDEDNFDPYKRPHPIDVIHRLTDAETFREFEETIDYCSIDQLGFPDYADTLERGIQKTGLESGLITGWCTLGGHAVVMAINNFGLVGSSLCDEIGEKFRVAALQAQQRRLPLISYAMGGGARMQEGTPAMHRNIPKVHHALNLLSESGIPHISIITDPTLGGTAISYGLRGDYMIVVKGAANIGFSGRRVVEQFQQRKVAANFQHGSWLLQRGFVDERVDPQKLRERLNELLDLVARGGRISDLQTRRKRAWEPKERVVLDAPTLTTWRRPAAVAAPPQTAAL